MVEVVVVVGASVAGGTAAATLREEGYDGRLILIGAEDLPPYERPPLSKEVLRGEQTAESAFVRPPGWWEEHGIEARLATRADRLDAGEHRVVLAGGERIPFDRAIVATGGRNRRLSVAGAGLDGVFDLRHVGDAERILEAARAGGRAVLIGMGFIGAEVAASLRQLGVDVTVVEVFETALYRVLGADIGRTIEAMHRDHGVEMVFGDTVERFEGGGRVERVVTKNGRSIECAFAVVGVGTHPVAELMQGRGIGANGGIEVDAQLRTATPGVFAAGDVASHDHPVFGRIRVEHYDNAVKMGQTAAHNALGRAETFDDPHWFWSDQYDTNLQMSGYAPTWDRMVVRGSLAERRYCAFLLQDGRLRSAVSMDWKRDVRRSFELIRSQVSVDERSLADPEVDLRTLVPAGREA
jgi:3-phenylpropionate/trans-cinnamate dioxygenase ferredoxin reductase component